MAKNDMGIRRPGPSQRVAATTTAASSTATSAFCTVVRMATDANVYFQVGATATVNDALLPAGEIDYFKINPGETISFITSTGTANVTVSEMH